MDSIKLHDSDYIKNPGEKAVISINYNGELESVLMNNEVVSAAFLDEENSWDYAYYYFLRLNPDVDILDFHLPKECMEVLYESNVGLQKYIPKILNYFEQGDYTVYLAYCTWTTIFHAQQDNSSEFEEYGSWLGLYSLKYKSSLNKELVRELEARIVNGERPLVLAYSKNYCHEANDDTANYVVYGVHALLAYRKLRVDPPVLFITNHSSDPYDLITEKHLSIFNDNELELYLIENPQVFVGDSEFALRYNKILDEILSRGVREKQIYGYTLFHLFQNAKLAVTDAHDEWVINRLSALKIAVQSGVRESLPWKGDWNEDWKEYEIKNKCTLSGFGVFRKWSKQFLNKPEKRQGLF